MAEYFGGHGGHRFGRQGDIAEHHAGGAAFGVCQIGVVQGGAGGVQREMKHRIKLREQRRIEEQTGGVKGELGDVAAAFGIDVINQAALRVIYLCERQRPAVIWNFSRRADAALNILPKSV